MPIGCDRASAISGALRDVFAERDRLAATARQRDAVGQDQRHHVRRSERRGLEQLRQVARLDRDRGDAAERSVGLVDAAGQRDRPAAADAAEHRLRNQQLVGVALLMRLEELAIDDVGRRKFLQRLDHVAAFVGDADEGDRRER